MGLEDPRAYNRRLEQVFDDRRIKAWPFKGSIIIEERSPDGNAGDVFLVDNWCLLYSFAYSHSTYRLKVQGLHRFDYDSYRILAGYVFDEGHCANVREATKEELEVLMRIARAA